MNGFKRLLLPALLTTTAFAAAPAAHAEQITVLNGAGDLAIVDSARPGTVLSSIDVTGLTGSPIALDYRPSDDVPYVVTYGVGDLGRVYTINTATGAASQVGGTFSLLFSEGDLGFDPVGGTLRFTGGAGTHYEINPDTGAATPRTNLSGRRFAASGYSPDRRDAAAATFFAVDVNGDGDLVRVGGIGGNPDPDAGAITKIGEVDGAGAGIISNGGIGLDVSPAGQAYFSSQPTGGVDTLFRLDLANAATASLGALPGTAIDIAVTPRNDIFTFATPSVSVVEGATARLTVTRPNIVGAASVLVGPIGGSADISPFPAALAFPNNTPAGTVAFVARADDVDGEPDRAVHLGLSSPAGRSPTVGSPGTATVVIRDNPRPRVTRASASKRSFRVPRKGKVATRFRFTLSEDARIGIAVRRALPGRVAGKRCKAPTRKTRRKRSCTRLKTVATLGGPLQAGARSVAFGGRVRGKALPAGSYRAEITARDASGKRTRKAVTVRFTVLRAR